MADFPWHHPASDESSAEANAAKRLQLYEEIEAYLLERASVLPLFSIEDGTDIRVQPWVHGFEFREYPDSIYNNVRLDQNAPKRTLLSR